MRRSRRNPVGNGIGRKLKKGGRRRKTCLQHKPGGGGAMGLLVPLPQLAGLPKCRIIKTPRFTALLRLSFVLESTEK